jgi:hypothetical protein
MKLALLIAATALLAGPSGASGAAGPSLPPLPADAPAPDETPLATPDDPVVLKCVKYADGLDQGTGRRRVKVVVTRSPRWGTVWRADSAFPAEGDAPPELWRSVCWTGGALERPLEMFDPSQSIPPL